jgi:hypothetical protein
MAANAQVDAYLAKLPADRREALAAVRAVVNKHLPKGYEETLSGKMIAWAIPLSVKPDTYNKQPLMIAAVAPGAGYNSLYLMGCYSMPSVLAKLQTDYKKAGVKLDMGKSCVRFKKLDDVVLPAVGRAIAAVPPKKLIALHDASHSKAAKTARRKKR